MTSAVKTRPIASVRRCGFEDQTVHRLRDHPARAVYLFGETAFATIAAAWPNQFLRKTRYF
jgi:hypothetical protein